jgi:hypothetical protein
VLHMKQVLETLRKNQLLANIKNYEFAKQVLVFLGYVIGMGELKINPTKIDFILKWPTPSNVTKVRSFVGATQYLRNFIT